MLYLTKNEHSFITLHCARCGHVHTAMRPCGYRFCPACSVKRAIRCRNHLTELFKLYKRLPKYRLRLITLSFSNPPDLKKGVDKLIRDFRRLRQRSFWTRNVQGGVAVIEITGRPGNWHPHLHIIVYSKFLVWKTLHRIWKQISGGNATHIKLISNDKAIYYITKYVSKIDMPESVQYEPNHVMKGRHLFIKIGEWASYDLPERKYLFTCVECGYSDWITEFELRHYSRGP